MKTPAFLPAPAAIGREAIVVIAGALLAAFVIGQLPGVRDWIKAQWGVAKAPDPV
ncbi:MAG TPA: hypothetical protein VNU48_07040 [Burkholderiaceae bacterium]|nr:hypothetical protein [Burkholderiaceae bacterium]